MVATATKGWSWMPPLLLSQARVAMIFHFENQYSVDLRRITRDDVTEFAEGRFRVQMPPIESDLRLKDVIPYDIQDGRVLLTRRMEGLCGQVPLDGEERLPFLPALLADLRLNELAVVPLERGIRRGRHRVQVPDLALETENAKEVREERGTVLRELDPDPIEGARDAVG